MAARLKIMEAVIRRRRSRLPNNGYHFAAFVYMTPRRISDKRHDQINKIQRNFPRASKSKGDDDRRREEVSKSSFKQPGTQNHSSVFSRFLRICAKIFFGKRRP